MRLALISDIHGNLPALESVLRAIKLHSPDRILSLGDQVNLGPCPREVLALLRAENVTCLHGNHERYILSVQQDDPGYTGVNFNLLRFQRDLLTPEEITFPKVIEIGGSIFCHAMPDDDRFPVFHVKHCTQRLREMTFDKPTHIFCGHGHDPMHYRMGNLTLDVIGSVGCMDAGVPGTAPYAILDIENDFTALQPYYAAYDTRVIPELFRRSGMAQACPIMTHITCLQMMNNRDYLLDFVGRANALAKAKGEAHVSEETWAQIDRTFAWPDGVGTKAFWETV